VGFLRRLLGGSSGDEQPEPPTETPETLDEAERTHELELARFEQDRTTDLVRRQQRYSDKSWTPPAQGGTARADDESEDAGGG
jgi:hypothetical protein